MTQEQAEKTRKARMTLPRWAAAEGLTAEQIARLNNAERAVVVPCALDAMRHEDLTGKISRAQADIAKWEAEQARYAYAVEELAKIKAKAKAD